MAKVNYVKKARKDNPAVKAGEPYFWWQFAYGPKRYSVKRPRPSQLTQSPYLSGVRSLVERVNDFEPHDADKDGFEELRDEIVAELVELRDQCQDSLDNMPESLQESPTGELLQERIDACDNALNSIECIDLDELDPENHQDDEDDEDEIHEIIMGNMQEFLSMMEDEISQCDM